MSDRLFQLIGHDMLKYREEMLKSDVPKTIQELVRSLIPPKGVRRKNIEGSELLDYCDEEEIETMKRMMKKMSRRVVVLILIVMI